MSDFTPLNEIDAGDATPKPQIGDVWRDRKTRALAWVCDVTETRACIEKVGGAREWMDIAELRRRYLFRRHK